MGKVFVEVFLTMSVRYRCKGVHDGCCAQIKRETEEFVNMFGDCHIFRNGSRYNGLKENVVYTFQFSKGDKTENVTIPVYNVNGVANVVAGEGGS